MDPARIHREPDVENLRTDFIGCPSLLTRHAKKKKPLTYLFINKFIKQHKILHFTAINTLSQSKSSLLSQNEPAFGAYVFFSGFAHFLVFRSQVASKFIKLKNDCFEQVRQASYSWKKLVLEPLMRLFTSRTLLFFSITFSITARYF